MQYPIRRKVRPEDARRSNRALVLQVIFTTPAQSRADIARATGLTKVTVSDVVSDLIDDGLVQESGTSEVARPGKPSTLLAFNPAGRDVIALDLAAPDRFRGAVYSLRGERQATREVALRGAIGAEALHLAITLASDLAAQTTRPVLGVGVGTPGTVDTAGTVLSAPNLAWHDVPLQTLLADDLSLPVRVENDANVAVLAERRFASGSDDLVRVQLSRGVGAGLLVGGTLVHGAASDAGEIGHVVIDEAGPLCSCGKRGCLETWTSVPSLTARIEADPAHRADVLAQAGHRLGLALAPVVGMLGLQHVVVGGPADLVAGPLLDAARACVSERTRSEFRPELHLSASSLGDDAVLLGATALVLLRQLGVA